VYYFDFLPCHTCSAVSGQSAVHAREAVRTAVLHGECTGCGPNKISISQHRTAKNNLLCLVVVGCATNTDSKTDSVYWSGLFVNGRQCGTVITINGHQKESERWQIQVNGVALGDKENIQATNRKGALETLKEEGRGQSCNPKRDLENVERCSGRVACCPVTVTTVFSLPSCLCLCSNRR